MQVGWIGLGAIGANMALRAIDAAHNVTAFARGKGVSAVKAKGAHLSDDYQALAAGSDIVVLCLFDDHQVRSVLFNEGALAAMRPGSILVIHTTGSPELAREIGERAPAQVAVLDATFSGGPDTVLAGELTVMVGGDAVSVDRVRPLLESYARSIFHLGPLGNGQTIKLLNNLLFATNLKNAAELLKIAASQGFDQSEVAKVIQCCSGASSAMRSFCSGTSLDATLARIRPYVEKDVATVASSAASNEIDIDAFHETVAYFKTNGEYDMSDNFADWKAICETKYRYCRCLDSKDWAGYADCFTEDMVLDTPPEGNVTQGRDAVVAKVRSYVETSVTNHQVHNPEITFDGPNAADVIWALQDRNIWSADRREALGSAGHTGFGHYRERYVRCPDGKWRIKRQKLSYVHMDHYAAKG